MSPFHFVTDPMYAQRPIVEAESIRASTKSSHTANPLRKETQDAMSTISQRPGV
jgi:hypothetical protein